MYVSSGVRDGWDDHGRHAGNLDRDINGHDDRDNQLDRDDDTHADKHSHARPLTYPHDDGDSHPNETRDTHVDEYPYQYAPAPTHPHANHYAGTAITAVCGVQSCSE